MPKEVTVFLWKGKNVTLQQARLLASGAELQEHRIISMKSTKNLSFLEKPFIHYGINYCFAQNIEYVPMNAENKENRTKLKD